MKTADIRSTFLDFFRAKGHEVIPSASLVPGNDPTLLFTNSGMVRFKHVFLGSEKLPYTRVTDVQRCLRAGGKHNDLDAVGYTARHHTFFEMLGNWSFGDYFKREAIVWSWELLTGTFGLPIEKLLVTVYHTDHESYDIWRQDIGLSASRIIRIGDNKGVLLASDNFWQMADTGPCGPCTEIYYDHGPDIVGGKPGSVNGEGDRYIEIWNLVFMQFDRAPDGSLSPLPFPCVDTGMGLERLAAVLQGVHSNYGIDLFDRLIAQIARLTGQTNLSHQSLRVIADHIRACSFLIVDNVMPSNEGRGYVLRRIIRRALRHGWQLGVHGDFFWKMVEPLVVEMGQAYPELINRQTFVEDILRDEEARFGQTLEHGMRLFNVIARTTRQTIDGTDVFRLYDTYGFPFDLTADIARERGLEVDKTGFDQAMAKQRERARAAGCFEAKNQLPSNLVTQLIPTVFLGYETLTVNECRILGMVRDGYQIEHLAPGEQGCLILDRTPFYAESGGQVGDTGELSSTAGCFIVTDTQKMGGVYVAHIGHWQGISTLKSGDKLAAKVNGTLRQATVLNHSATHLLNAALRKVLGGHVQQKGSRVASDHLRFDFTHPRPVSGEELARIETLINARIRDNLSTHACQMTYDAAMASGALALVSEKYGKQVRVLQLGDFSTELCGGTHVARTGDIGLFKVVSEMSVASGVRRIEAVTGTAALALVTSMEHRLDELSRLLASKGDDAVGKLRHLLERHKKLECELVSLRSKATRREVAELAHSAQEIKGIKVVAARLEGLDVRSLREAIDNLKQKLDNCVLLLAGADKGRVALVAGVQGKALSRIRAGDAVAHVAGQIEGRGGGRPDMAQGGGMDTPQLPTILTGMHHWVAQRLSSTS